VQPNSRKPWQKAEKWKLLMVGGFLRLVTEFCFALTFEEIGL
jgi:hypothetical protein